MVLRCGIVWAVLCSFSAAAFAQRTESDRLLVEKINEFLRAGWDDNQVKPSPRIEDGEFARRVALDLVGRIPSYDELMDFLDDSSVDKREQFVDQLLDHPDYVRHWTNLWANWLVGRSGNGQNRRALERWLRRAMYENLPYDRFVYELVAAEGNSRENGAVGFLASHLNDGAVPATSNTSRIFLGIQVQCTQCHNHPFNDWKQQQFWSMNAFFRGTRRVNDRERGEFGLADSPTTDVIFFETRTGLMQATERRFVDGTRVPISEDERPREQLARLMIDPEQPYLGNTQVNRMWGHFFGFGFTRPTDDMGPHNPPSHPELLEFLAEEYRKSGYDTKRLMRWITASEAYQLSSRFNPDNELDDPSAGNTPLFSRMYLKQFTAEQLYDSLLIATAADQTQRDSESAESQRRAWLNQFVQTFGTDENDETTTFNGTIPQALVMMNGPLIQTALSGKEGSFLRRVLDAPGGDIRRDASRSRGNTRRTRRLSPQAQARLARNQTRSIPDKIETLFLVTLARTPSNRELEAFNDIFQEGGSDDPIAGLQDVFWALLNSNEFIINH